MSPDICLSVKITSDYAVVVVRLCQALFDALSVRRKVNSLAGFIVRLVHQNRNNDPASSVFANRLPRLSACLVLLSSRCSKKPLRGLDLGAEQRPLNFFIIVSLAVRTSYNSMLQVNGTSARPHQTSTQVTLPEHLGSRSLQLIPPNMPPPPNAPPLGRLNSTIGHPPFNITMLEKKKKNQTRATGAWTGAVKGANATGAALARRQWENKDSFAYLWASNTFKYGFIGLIVLIVVIIAIMIIRYRRKRAAAGY
jgi:hypothetical protein